AGGSPVPRPRHRRREPGDRHGGEAAQRPHRARREATGRTSRDRRGVTTAVPADLRSLPLIVPFAVACKTWEISPARGYELAARGELPFQAIRVGGRWKVRRADLLRSHGLVAEAEPTEGADAVARAG